MHSRRREMSCVDPGRSRLLSYRTIPLVIGLLVTVTQPETMAEMISVELEASMQSSVLSELRAAASSVGQRPPATGPESATKNGGAHAGVPDSSAVTGQVFQVKVPPGPANASCNVRVSTLRS